MHVKLIPFVNSFPYTSLSVSLPTLWKIRSLIDLLLVRNKDRIIFSGVGDPFLQQDLRYHCPVFGVFSLNLKLNISSAVYGNMIGAIMIL